MGYMGEALRLAEYGRYSVAPNPLVGCVIEKDGKIVGRGYHQKAGEAHAEVFALSEAGSKAKDANVYVTLEPCCHHGYTPPCIDALIAAQVKTVHIPFIDPNPLVNGCGVSKLEAAGIKVYVGEKEQEAKQQNEIFLHYITTNSPYVVAKWAMTLDGKIAISNVKTADRNSHWITQLEARKHTHYTRCWLGAILVGVDTIINDDPQLTPYLIDEITDNGGKNRLLNYPWRIILDGSGRIPLAAKVLHSSDPQKTIIATTERSSAGWRQQLIDSGNTVLMLPTKNGKANPKISATSAENHIDLSSLLTALGSQKISGLLVEGGQKVLTSFVTEQLINKLHVYLAPRLVGSTSQMPDKITTYEQTQFLSPLADIGINNFAQACNLSYEKFETVGEDLFISAKPIWGQK